MFRAVGGMLSPEGVAYVLRKDNDTRNNTGGAGPMSDTIDGLFDQYVAESGDSPPIRPKRLWRKAFPLWIPTRDGQRYFAESGEHQLRYMRWLRRKLAGGPVLG